MEGHPDIPPKPAPRPPPPTPIQNKAERKTNRVRQGGKRRATPDTGVATDWSAVGEENRCLTLSALGKTDKSPGNYKSKRIIFSTTTFRSCMFMSKRRRA